MAPDGVIVCGHAIMRSQAKDDTTATSCRSSPLQSDRGGCQILHDCGGYHSVVCAALA